MFKKLLRFNLAIATLATTIITAGTVIGVTDTASLTIDVLAGTLSVTMGDTTIDLGDVTYSHSTQAIADIDIGTIQIVDLRGSGAGWTSNWQAVDWTGGGGMDYDGNGTTTGQLCIDYDGTHDLNDWTVNAGDDDRATWTTFGVDDCFDSGTSNIALVVTGSSKGDGDYTLTATTAQMDQFIPAQQAVAAYSSTLTIDVV